MLLKLFPPLYFIILSLTDVVYGFIARLRARISYTLITSSRLSGISLILFASVSSSVPQDCISTHSVCMPVYPVNPICALSYYIMHPTNYCYRNLNFCILQCVLMLGMGKLRILCDILLDQVYSWKSFWTNFHQVPLSNSSSKRSPNDTVGPIRYHIQSLPLIHVPDHHNCNSTLMLIVHT